jgi:hypothetical protein
MFGVGGRKVQDTRKVKKAAPGVRMKKAGNRYHW